MIYSKQIKMRGMKRRTNEEDKPMREVGIVGVGHTKFGKTDLPFLELLGSAALEALDDAGITPGSRRVCHTPAG